MRTAVSIAIPMMIVSFILMVVFETICYETNNDAISIITNVLYHIFWIITIICAVVCAIGELIIRVKLLNLL